MNSLAQSPPNEIRRLIREGRWTEPTVGVARGYTQANIFIIPEKKALDFAVFCVRNPKPCPLIEMLEPGNPFPQLSCRDSDIRTDLNKYRVYRYGQLLAETGDIKDYWREDFVTFILGCSFTFEGALIATGIPLRHVQKQKCVPMYVTNIACSTVNGIQANMVASMRPIK